MLFKVIGNLKHDGTDYHAGDTIDIEVGVGEALVEDRILEVIPGEPRSNFHPDADDEDGEASVYADMTVRQLKKVAEKKGLDVKGLRKRDDIIEVLTNPAPIEDEEEDNNEEGEEGKEGEEESGEEV